MDQLDAEAAKPEQSLSLGAFDRRAATRFALRFLLIFGLFCLPMAFIGAGYARAFCAVGNAILPEVDPASRLAFHLDLAPLPEAPTQNRAWEAKLSVGDQRAGTRAVMPLETMSLTYVPVVVFLALALATPIADRQRKLQLVVLGFLLISLIELLLVALSVVSILNDLSPIRIFELGPTLTRAVGILFRALMAPGMAYAIPGLLWWFLLRVTRPAPTTAQQKQSVIRA